MAFSSFLYFKLNSICVTGTVFSRRGATFAESILILNSLRSLRGEFFYSFKVLDHPVVYFHRINDRGLRGVGSKGAQGVA
ncbi:MAG: hypothetical protein KAG97_03420, partial [Victivallales bacterium]|nr:hypothetical protein [Victivallales bacterium]